MLFIVTALPDELTNVVSPLATVRAIPLDRARAEDVKPATFEPVSVVELAPI